MASNESRAARNAARKAEQQRKMMTDLAGRSSGTAQTIVMGPGFDPAAFVEEFSGDPMFEPVRTRMLMTLVDRALNHEEPGTDLRPIVTTMAGLLGVDVEEWDE